MKRMLTLIFCVYVSAVCFGAAGTQEDPCPAWGTKTVHLAFDAAGYEEVTLVTIEAKFYDSDGTLVKEHSVIDDAGLTPDGDRFKIPLYDVLVALDDGIYSVHVRVFDSGGSVSDWSNKLWFKKQWKDLTPPQILGPMSLRGDVNGDKKVDIADITTLMDYLYGGGKKKQRNSIA